MFRFKALSTPLCVSLCLIACSRSAVAPPGPANVAATYPPVIVPVVAHVKATLAESYIDPVAIAHICVLEIGDNRQPADVCSRPYEVNWQVRFDDPTGKCGGQCAVLLTQKGEQKKNPELFGQLRLQPGDNAKPPARKARYGWTSRKRKFVYGLQITINEAEVGKPLDPDIMPHPPGG